MSAVPAILLPGLAALAAACVAWAAGDLVAELADALLRRLRPRRLRDRLRQAQADVAIGADPLRALSIDPLPLLGIAAGVLGAALARDALLTPASLALGVAAAAVFRSRRGVRRSRAALEAILLLVEAFESVLAVQRSAMGALEAATRLLPEGEVRRAALAAGDRHRLGRPSDECLRPLRDFGSPFMDDFLLVLERLPASDAALTAAMLRQLAARLARTRARAQRAKVTMARLRGTVRVMQGAFLAALGTSLSLGLWRAYWLSGAGPRLLFVVLMVGGLGASAYFERRVESLGEEFA